MVDQLVPTGLVPADGPTLAKQLQTNCDARGDKAAFISLEDGKTLTWNALFEWVERLSHFLHSKGIVANDRITVLGENSFEQLILYYGIQIYGATYCTRLFASLTKLKDENPANTHNAPEDRCVICFTSGTSAQPKGVLHSFSNYQAIAQHQLDRWALTSDDRVLEFRAISWASAHMISLNATMLSGATLLFAKNFSRSRFVSWVDTYHPTIIVAVPTVVNMLLEHPIENGKQVFSSVRFISCSTAPLMPDAHLRFEEIYGVKLVQLYGMSEGGIVAANAPHTRVIGSVGTAGLYQEITIRNETGETVPLGEIGEIETISAQHAHAYLHAGGEIETIRGKPLKTGDLGYLDDAGFLRITGRAKDVIIRGGVNISPLEIDALISQHPDIIEAVTFGIPDPVYGENIASWVTISSNSKMSTEDLERYCTENLPEAKRPKSIEIVEDIPKNHRGKIDRNVAKELWQSAQ